MKKIETRLLTLFIGRALLALLSLASLRLMTTFLSAEEVGVYYLYMGVVAVVSLTFLNSVGMYFNRHLHASWAAGKFSRYFSYYIAYLFGVALLALLIVFGMSIVKSPIYLSLVWLVAANLIFNSLFITGPNFLNLLGFYRWFVLLQILGQGLGLFLAWAFVRAGPALATRWAFGLLIGQGLAAVLSVMILWKNSRKIPEIIKKELNHITLSELFRFSWPVALTTLFMWGQNQSFRVLLESPTTMQQLGILSVTLGLVTSMVTVFDSLISQYLHPNFYNRIASGGEHQRLVAWHALFEKCLGLYLVFSIFLIGFSRQIAEILLDHKFHGYLWLVAWGVGIEFLRLLTNVIYLISHAELKTKSSIAPFFAGSVVVVGGLLIILNNGSDVLAQAPAVLLMGGVVTFVFMWINMQKLMKIKWPVSVSARALMFSSPLLLGLLMPPGLGLWARMGALVIGGLYFVGTVVMLINVYKTPRAE